MSGCATVEQALEDVPVVKVGRPDYPPMLTNRQEAAVDLAERAGVLDTIAGRPGFRDLLTRMQRGDPLTPAEARAIPPALATLERNLAAQERADAQAETEARLRREAALAVATVKPPAPPPTVEQQIRDLRACITEWQRVIDRQKRIGQESGFVDKGLLYAAGSRVIDCQDQLKKLEQQAPPKKK